MKRAQLLLMVGIFLFLLGVDASGDYVLGEILVKFMDEADGPRVKRVNAAFACRVVGGIPGINVLRLRIPPSATVSDMVSVYGEEPDVEYAEPNYLVHALSVTPNDPYYGIQWHLPKIKVDEVWSEQMGSRNVTIAVLDTGVDLDHPDLDEQVVSGFDFVNYDSEADDDQGHGTHMAGTIAAETNNGEGVAGINWHAGLMPVKVLDETGEGTHENVALGLIFAADNGARVINLSFGGEDSSQTIEDAINYAYGKGCILVAGTGNSGGAVMFPGRSGNVIAVGATDEEDNWCDDSIWGEGFSSSSGAEVDVVAPGNNIASTYIGGNFATGSGTSMATACVSGLAALIVSVNPQLSNSKVREIIEGTCDDLMEDGWDQYTGHGRINAQKAVQETPVRPSKRPRRWPFSELFNRMWHSVEPFNR